MDGDNVAQAFDSEAQTQASGSKLALGGRPSDREKLLTYIGLISSTFGVSSLGLSATISQSGLVTFLGLLLCSLLINYFSYLAIIHLTRKHRLSSFSELSELILGRFKFITDLLFIITNIGILVANLIFSSILFCKLSESLGFTRPLLIHPKGLFWVFLLGGLMFPLVVKKKLKDIACFTVLTLVTAFYVVVFLAYRLFISQRAIDFHREVKLVSTNRLCQTYSYIFFCFLCQQNLIGIFNELGVSNGREMKRLVSYHFATLLSLYLIIGIIGYLIFCTDPALGSNTLLTMFTDNTMTLMIANTLVTGMSLIAFLCTFNPTKVMVTAYINKFRKKNAEKQETSSCWELDTDLEIKNVAVTVALLLGLIGLAAVLISYNIGFMEVVDALGEIVCPLLFIFMPIGYCYKKHGGAAYLIVLLMTAGFYVACTYRYIQGFIGSDG